MDTPLQVTFRDFHHSNAIEQDVQSHVAKLEKIAKCLMSCRVVLRQANRRHQQGNLFDVSIHVTVPGAELAVGHGSRGRNHAHEDVYVAIRDAFLAMQRQLKTYMAQRRRETKPHHHTPHAKVVRLFPQDGYGFLQTDEGREIYFHVNSVINDGWDDIEVGTEVRFAESMGENGPQATTVECLRAG